MSSAPVRKLFYHSSRLMRTVFLQLHRQQKDNAFCDVILQAEGLQIPAHSCILSACSPFFTERLSLVEPVAQQLVELSGLKVSALARLVHYVYTAELEVTRDEVEEVLAAARHLRILELEAVHLEGGKLVKADVGRRLNRDCFQSREYIPRSGIGTLPVLTSAVAADSHFRKRSHDSTASSRAGPCKEGSAIALETNVRYLEVPPAKKRISLLNKELDSIKQKAVSESDIGNCLSRTPSGGVFKEDVVEKNKRNADLFMPRPHPPEDNILGSSLSKADDAADTGELEPGMVKKLKKEQALDVAISECSLAALMEVSESAAKSAELQDLPVKEVAKGCPEWENGPDLSGLCHIEQAPSSDHITSALPKPDVPTDHDTSALPKPDVPTDHATSSLPKPDVPTDHATSSLSEPGPSDLTSFSAAVSFPIHFTNFHHKAPRTELSPIAQPKPSVKNPCIARTQSTSSDTSGDESPVGRMKLRKRINSVCWEVVHEREEKQNQSGICPPTLVREGDTAESQILEIYPASSDSRVQSEPSSVLAAETTSAFLGRAELEQTAPGEGQSHFEFALHSPTQWCEADRMRHVQEVKELLNIVLSTSEISEFSGMIPDLCEPAVLRTVNGEERKECSPTKQQLASSTWVSSTSKEGEGSIPADQQSIALEHEMHTCAGERDHMQCSVTDSVPLLPRTPSDRCTGNLAGKLDALMLSSNKTRPGTDISRKQQQAKPAPASPCGECSPCIMPQVAVCHRRSLRQITAMRKKKMQSSDGGVTPAKYTEPLHKTSNRSGPNMCIIPKRRRHSRTPKCTMSVEAEKGLVVSTQTSELGKTDCTTKPLVEDGGQALLAANSLPEVTQAPLDSEEEIDILSIIGGELPVIPCGIRPEPSSESDTEVIVVD